MDQLTHGVLRFDRFALDLTRGFLRADDRDIDLRPKAFEVLCHLAANAGRLVPKQELYEAVWPNATVTDDSLVQCIRELRDKLGDDTHRLIKTVHRRGYLLDAAVMTAVPQFLSERAPKPIEEPRKVATDLARRGALVAFQPQKWRLWAAATAGLLCIAAGAIYLAALFADTGQKHVSLAQTASVSLQPPPVSELFTDRDAKRVAVLADNKQLPLPPFQIRTPAHDVSEDARRFVGIWVSDKGWMGSNRQFMLIVTNVDREGIAAGYFVNGPSQPMSFFHTAAHSSSFKARISGDSLSYSGAAGEHLASLTTQGGIELKLTLRDGRVGVVVLNPVWTLVEAERTATPAGL
jgi:DNA-binding winged helix-turn-helix (wHTH) protein